MRVSVRDNESDARPARAAGSAARRRASRHARDDPGEASGSSSVRRSPGCGNPRRRPADRTPGSSRARARARAGLPALRVLPQVLSPEGPPVPRAGVQHDARSCLHPADGRRSLGARRCESTTGVTLHVGPEPDAATSWASARSRSPMTPRRGPPRQGAAARGISCASSAGDRVRHRPSGSRSTLRRRATAAAGAPRGRRLRLHAPRARVLEPRPRGDPPYRARSPWWPAEALRPEGARRTPKDLSRLAQRCSGTAWEGRPARERERRMRRPCRLRLPVCGVIVATAGEARSFWSVAARGDEEPARTSCHCGSLSPGGSDDDRRLARSMRAAE